MSPPTWRNAISRLSTRAPYRARRPPSSKSSTPATRQRTPNLADALDEMGNGQGTSQHLLACFRSPTIDDAARTMEWLLDRQRRRSIPHRLERCGYIACRNPDADDGLWTINGRRQTLYTKASLTPEERLQAAYDYVAEQTKTVGSS